MWRSQRGSRRRHIESRQRGCAGQDCGICSGRFQSGETTWGGEGLRGAGATKTCRRTGLGVSAMPGALAHRTSVEPCSRSEATTWGPAPTMASVGWERISRSLGSTSSPESQGQDEVWPQHSGGKYLGAEGLVCQTCYLLPPSPKLLLATLQAPCFTNRETEALAANSPLASGHLTLVGPLPAILPWPWSLAGRHEPPPHACDQGLAPWFLWSLPLPSPLLSTPTKCVTVSYLVLKRDLCPHPP